MSESTVRLVRPEHPAKVSEVMEVRLLGMVMVVSPMQPLNAKAPMEVTVLEIV